MQIPASREEQPRALVYDGGHPAGKQLGRKGPWVPGGHEIEHELAMCSCGKGEWYLGLH